MEENGELRHRFSYHPPSDEWTRARHEAIRNDLGDLAQALNRIIPDCREKALMMTKLEEAMFWGNAAIARNGIQHGE